jgi:Family of unknown function (DUF6093)
MSATTATLRGRAAAENLMIDACTVQRVTGSATNDTTGVVTPTYSTIYTGKCRVQQVVPIAKPANVGEAAVWLQRLVLQLPMSVVGIQSDDLVTITASVLDGDLVGRTFHVRELGHKTHATARRVQLEEITS